VLRKRAGNSASDRRLPRASQALQPEDAPLILSVRPVVYLFEDVDASVLKASGFMLPGIQIEGRFCCEGQAAERAV
jgi:hypothetical protein